MDGAVITDSTLPPQCGHFFKCGPATFSIFSVFRPHFKHLYSYRGTDSPFFWCGIEEYTTLATTVFAVRARLLAMSAKHAAENSGEQPSHSLTNGVEPRGCLYIVGTPIGNLEDITLRALRILKEVDLIACEDTRHTQKLLNYYDISKTLVSYHEHNEMTRSPELLIKLEQGAKIALVSDAGMPLVSDPGYRLVTLCVRHKIPVVPVPGPSAMLAALAAAGLPNEEFLFVGFLPQRSGERRRMLAHLRIEERTMIFYEAPHRVAESIADAQEILGDRPACIAREVTKLHEEFLRGKLSQLAESLAERPARGETTLVVGRP